MAKPFFMRPVEISMWRYQNNASISQTAAHFGISTSTVRRAERLVSDSKTLVQLWNDYAKKQAEQMRAWKEKHPPTNHDDPAVKALNEFISQIDSIPRDDLIGDLVAVHDAERKARYEAELEVIESTAKLRATLLESASKHLNNDNT